MSHSAVLRATSLATSGVLLAAIVIAGLTMSITMRANFPSVDAPIVDMQRPEEPPPTRPVRTPPPPTMPDELPTRTDLAPLDPPADPIDFDVRPIEPVDMRPTITRPQWVRRPSGLTTYYPRRAAERGITGEALLDCSVSTAGLLNCAVVSETPTGWGFGQAAVRIARDHRMVPATRDGIAVEGRYSMRVPFQLD